MKIRFLKTIVTIAVVLALAVLCMPVSFAATSGSFGDNLTWTYDPSTEKLTIKGSGDMPDDERPWEDNDIYYFKTVEIEEGVTSIGAYAFSDTGLGYVRIPEGVTRIGDGAFESTPLFEITMPSTVTEIGDGAFNSETDWGTITVNYGGAHADWDQISFGANNEMIEHGNIHAEAPQNLLSGDLGDNLSWTINLDTSTLRIEGSGDMMDFFDSEGYPTFDAGSGPVPSDELRMSYFLNSTSLVQKVQICEGVTSIGMGCFLSEDIDVSFESVEIPKSVTSIGVYAFGYVSDVYYAGTEDEWANIYIEPNGYLLSANFHYGAEMPEDEAEAKDTETEKTTEAEELLPPPESNMDTVMIVGIVAGAAVVIAAIVATVVIFSKKNKQKEK